MLAGLAGRLQRRARPVGARGAEKVVTSQPRPILLKGAGSHRVVALERAPRYCQSLKGEAGAELVRKQR